MKNLTLALDEETYKKARIVAAQKGLSLSGMVRQYLQSLDSNTKSDDDWIAEQEALFDKIWARHPHFNSGDNLKREELYDRNALR